MLNDFQTDKIKLQKQCQSIFISFSIKAESKCVMYALTLLLYMKNKQQVHQSLHIIYISLYRTWITCCGKRSWGNGICWIWKRTALGARNNNLFMTRSVMKKKKSEGLYSSAWKEDRRQIQSEGSQALEDTFQRGCEVSVLWSSQVLTE